MRDFRHVLIELATYKVVIAENERLFKLEPKPASSVGHIRVSGAIFMRKRAMYKYANAVIMHRLGDKEQQTGNLQNHSASDKNRMARIKRKHLKKGGRESCGQVAGAA